MHTRASHLQTNNARLRRLIPFHEILDTNDPSLILSLNSPSALVINSVTLYPERVLLKETILK